jgi:hypothetical protein
VIKEYMFSIDTVLHFIFSQWYNKYAMAVPVSYTSGPTAAPVPTPSPSPTAICSKSDNKDLAQHFCQMYTGCQKLVPEGVKMNLPGIRSDSLDHCTEDMNKFCMSNPGGYVSTLANGFLPYMGGNHDSQYACVGNFTSMVTNIQQNKQIQTIPVIQKDIEHLIKQVDDNTTVVDQANRTSQKAFDDAKCLQYQCQWGP